MRTLQSILLATDFQPESDEALNTAIQLATAFGSQVSVLCVLEDLKGFVRNFYRQKTAERLMQPVLQRLAEQQVTVAQSSIKFGTTATTIVDAAQEGNVDLVVLGVGKRAHLEGGSVGPIAEAVIAHAPQPVLAVLPGAPRVGFKRILCPVDQSSASARGLRNAVRLAKVFGGEVIVLSVVPEVSWLTAALETGEVVDAKAEYATEWVQEFDRFLETVDWSGTPWKREVRYGGPHEQIVTTAKEHGADLIVMGATGRTGLVQVLLGSTTRRLLRSLPCSLLTVKQEDVVEELFESDVRVMASLMAEAQALSAAGTFLSAIAKYRQVLSRNPFHLSAMEGLVSAYDRIGETVEADKFRRRLASSRRVAQPRLDSPDVSF
jgi:nucleotide-binding universal stress UspA family protein